MKEHFGDDVEEDSHINQSPNYKVFDIIIDSHDDYKPSGCYIYQSAVS